MTRTQVRRYDRGELRSSVRTDEGYYLVEGYVSRPGVLEYVQADGTTRRELVLPEELHKTDSLATLARKPVTLEHPDEFLAPGNVGEHAVGDLDGDIEVEALNGFVRVRMAVRRADGIAAIDAGVVELSPGYVCELDETPGTHEIFGEYDAIQRNRKYNHTAITRAGRAGSAVKLRRDSASQITPFDNNALIAPTNEEIEMDIKSIVEAQFARRDADDKVERLEAENAALLTKIEELEKQLAAAAPKNDEDDKKNDEDNKKNDEDDIVDEDDDDKRADSAQGRLKWYARRQDAIAVAEFYGADVSEVAEISAVKLAVVKHVHGAGVRTDSAYVAAAFDIIKKNAADRVNPVRNDSYSRIGDALAPASNASTPRQDSAEDVFRGHYQRAFARK